MNYCIPHGAEQEHAAKLKRGLHKLGPEFLAFICWGCEGTGHRRIVSCSICGNGKQYGCSLGLLTGNNQPAAESVVNQVLIAAERP